jgi:hypothetical protein
MTPLAPGRFQKLLDGPSCPAHASHPVGKIGSGRVWSGGRLGQRVAKESRRFLCPIGLMSGRGVMVITWSQWAAQCHEEFKVNAASRGCDVRCPGPDAVAAGCVTVTESTRGVRRLRTAPMRLLPTTTKGGEAVASAEARATTAPKVGDGYAGPAPCYCNCPTLPARP